MFPCVDTYKLTNDVGRTSKGKNQIIKFSTKVDNVQRDKKLQQPNQSKGSVQMPSYSQLKSKDSLNNVALLYAHSRARTH